MEPDLHYTVLPERGVVRLSGPDGRSFLQGLVSNDMNTVGADRTVYAALLTPQGKYLFDFFVFADFAGGDDLLMECEAARREDLIRRLSLYKLRARVTLEDISAECAVAVLWGPEAPERLGVPAQPGATQGWSGGIICTDPRRADAGLRAILPKDQASRLLAASGFSARTATDYDFHRLGLGLADASRDLIVEKSTLLESGFDDVNGIDWNKGCYMGQELTARTKYRGLVKKRLVPVRVDGPPPAPGTPVMDGPRTVGEMRSAQGTRALALLRLEYVQGEKAAAALSAGDAKISV